MNRDEVMQKLKEGAMEVGKSVHEHAADTIVDMKTSARDSIVRVGILMLVVGLVVGRCVLP